MKVGNNTLFAGVPEGKKLVTEIFTSDQLEPCDVLPPRKLQSLDATLCFDNITQKQSDQWYEWYAILELAPKRKMLTWYYWKSDKHRIFAVQCNECRCLLKYDWNSYDPKQNKRDGICWILAFLMTSPEDCMDDDPGPMPSCARYGCDRMGKSGIMKDATDGDWEKA